MTNVPGYNVTVIWEGRCDIPYYRATIRLTEHRKKEFEVEGRETAASRWFLWWLCQWTIWRHKRTGYFTPAYVRRSWIRKQKRRADKDWKFK